MQADETCCLQKGQGLAVGYGIVTTFCEGMAAADAAEGHDAAAENSEALHGDVGVLRTGGKVDALGAAEAVEDGREDGTVESEDGAEEKQLHVRPTVPPWEWRERA